MCQLFFNSTLARFSSLWVDLSAAIGRSNGSSMARFLSLFWLLCGTGVAQAEAVAEVEMRGRIRRPTAAVGQLHLYVTDGPCWRPATRAFSDTPLSSNDFFVEVIVPQRTQLWLCAAVVDGTKPPRWSGALSKALLWAKGLGEVEFQGLEIALTRQPPVATPKLR